MLAFLVRVQQARKRRTTPTNSPKGDHQANGRAEKGVRALQNMARRMRLVVESHLEIRLPHRHPVLMWLIEWVGGSHNRFKDGCGDGKTPRERAGWQTQSLVMRSEKLCNSFRSEVCRGRTSLTPSFGREFGWCSTVALTRTSLARRMECTGRRLSRESLRTSVGTLSKSSLSPDCPGIPCQMSMQMIELERPTKKSPTQRSYPKIPSCQS